MDESVAEIGWHPVEDLPPLAFDHKEIIEYSLKERAKGLNFALLLSSFCQKKFTLTELQKSYELILAKRFR